MIFWKDDLSLLFNNRYARDKQSPLLRLSRADEADP
nr:MAG TPA: hypothetical protein [Caudoviricetes sp.]